jgi:hypothetical protein
MDSSLNPESSRSSPPRPEPASRLLSDGEVLGIVERAYHNARAAAVVARRPSDIVYMRSRRFIAELACALRSHYPPETGFVVFAGRDGANRATFGREELLGDVSVFEVASIPQGNPGAGNPYLKRALWMIESEFAQTPKAALRDFIKFVGGSAEQKLFVAPLTRRGEAVLAPLAFPARHCTGVLYAALVPHPRTWGDGVEPVSLWRWSGSAWAICRSA